MIKPEETEFIGRILMVNEQAINDDIAQKVNYLTKNYLVKIKTNESGWDTLYQDVNDSRFWEKLFLQSELNGGGPPSLINISEEEARLKYKF